ncbi:MBL fold metallo-hydrolase [Cryptosporangium sp. NPDC048952]|uniref:MBL fold metallo-hydrolase n=1 Tax=Cryptosporangium sp. NPDC048952 TaxID=3363961 RepID=UPI0037165219
MKITHLGGPTTLIEVGGWRILTDPTFDPPGRRYAFGWGTASRKVAGPALPADAVGPVDLVLLSHDHHADNLDDAGRALLGSAAVVVTTISGSRRLTPAAAGQDRGEAIRGLMPWEVTVVGAPGKAPLKITATPCRHGPPLSRPIVGDVVGFSVEWDGGQFWMTGDTVLYGALREAAARLTVDVLVLHLGSVKFGLTGPLRYSMSGAEGAELIRLAKPRVAVPVHYEGWSHFSERPEHLRQALGDRVRWLEPGVATEL